MSGKLNFEPLPAKNQPFPSKAGTLKAAGPQHYVIFCQMLIKQTICRACSNPRIPIMTTWALIILRCGAIQSDSQGQEVQTMSIGKRLLLEISSIKRTG